MSPPCSDEEFIQLVTKIGATATAKQLGISERNARKRRQKLEQTYQVEIQRPLKYSGYSATNYPAEIEIDIQSGVALIGSDSHIWPGKPSTAMRAFIHLCKELKPKAVILNGDVLDFPSISRHPKIGWQTTPSPQDEIEAAQDILHQIEQAASRAYKLWPMGNHDLRFPTRLANSAPEFARIHGIQLQDHFPQWENCWSVGINSNVLVKHRFKGGRFAPDNNTLWAGCSVITGHLHSQRVASHTDRLGTRYGVDTGCLADVDHAAFTDYSEASPKNWRSGFTVLTFIKGILLPPELVTVWGKDSVVFRGEVIKL